MDMIKDFDPTILEFIRSSIPDKQEFGKHKDLSVKYAIFSHTGKERIAKYPVRNKNGGLEIRRSAIIKSDEIVQLIIKELVRRKYSIDCTTRWFMYWTKYILIDETVGFSELWCNDTDRLVVLICIRNDFDEATFKVQIGDEITTYSLAEETFVIFHNTDSHAFETMSGSGSCITLEILFEM